MSSKERGSSSAPIVAELGRPETPDERAARVAASRAERRRNQTIVNFVGALIASLAIVAFLVIVVVRPDPGPRPAVDFASVADSAQASVEVDLVVPPALPEGWSANRAELSSDAGGVQTWSMGIITASGGYLALDQGIEASSSWVDLQVAGDTVDGTVELGGVTWDSYDRSDLDDPGNVVFALVRELNGSTLVISGEASDADIATFVSLLSAEVAP